jgi:glutamyl-tRNA synthetase
MSVDCAPTAALEAWVHGRVPPGAEARFVAAVRANLVLPADAAEWAQVVYGELPGPDEALRAVIVAAGAPFFAAALAAVAERVDYAALIAALRTATGRKGRELFQPLRAALTHRLDGPELAAPLGVMPAISVRARLARAREFAARARASAP